MFRPLKKLLLQKAHGLFEDYTMSREKEIEEMANILWHIPNNYSLNSYNDCERIAECIYDDGGYRKQKEGHWFILEYEYFTCSECGYYHPNGCDSTKEAKEKLAKGNVPKYCDECGALMLEEE